MIKKLLLIGGVCMMIAGTSHAMTYFLVAQWFEGGNNMCKYSNGTVLNVGARICPLSIEG